MRFLRTKQGIVLVPLTDVIQVVEKERPTDRPGGETSTYIFENGRRNACDAILKEFRYTETKAKRKYGNEST